ncbi:sensor histidine kinase [Pseudorhodoferax sp.]|uniref:sensor histidine kinase n=1 Tax=Pseudorhodoferax sp. TaxID=1993553 RepID=UPI002DD61B76|nr:ATP-binding protein [Pseudorhodoferax sp.]
MGTLFDSLPVGAYRSLPDGTLLRANPALARLNGFETVEQLHAAVHDINAEWYLVPGRRDEFCRQLAQHGHVAAFVSEVRRYATQERIWVSEHAHVVRAADGRPVFYEGTVEDITERVHTQAALALNEQSLREITEHIPGMAYRVHYPGRQPGARRFSFVSPGVFSLYGVRPEAVLADAQVLLPYRHPDDTGHFETELVAAVAAGSPLTAVYRVLVRGQVKWLQMSSSVVADSPDEQVRVGVLLDITAHRQAAALRRDRDRADLARQQMTHFLSRLSHELRTPLNAVLGFGQLIEMESDTPALQRRWATTLLDSGRHLLALVDDVLDLTGAQSGLMAVQASDVAPVVLLHEAWSMVSAAAEARGLRYLAPAAADPGLRVRADPRRLLQVLVNLLSNAVKYNRQGGAVTVQVRPHGPDRVQITVADNGPGMSPDQMTRLFSPFDRLGAQDSPIPGTGLGLSLSRQLTQAMGGTLDATSQPGQGCTFVLTLPAGA